MTRRAVVAGTWGNGRELDLVVLRDQERVGFRVAGIRRHDPDEAAPGWTWPPALCSGYRSRPDGSSPYDLADAVSRLVVPEPAAEPGPGAREFVPTIGVSRGND